LKVRKIDERNIRTLKELLNTEELKDIKLDVDVSQIGNITFVIPKETKKLWLYEAFIRTFNSFNHNYLYMTNQDKKHKKYVMFMRRMYNHFPLVFGYAVKHPNDEYSDLGVRIAMERLILKINQQK